MMEGWKEIQLAQVCKVKKGEQLNKLELTSSGDYPCINGGIEASGYTHQWNRLENTITISEGGNSCGFISFQKTKFWSGGHCYTLLNIKDELETNFLYHSLKGRERSIMQLRVGSGLPNIQQKAIKTFKFIIPTSPTEQTHIANILSTADEAIAQTEQLIAKYQRIKIGLMQDLLTKGIDDHGNIRNNATHKFVVKNGLEVPEEWEVEILNNVSSITRLAGYEYSSVWKIVEDGEIISLRGFNVGENKIIQKSFDRISAKLSKQLNRSKLYHGDIVFPCVGTIGNAVVIRENDKYHINQNIAKITPKKFISSDYVVNYLMSEQCRREIDRFNATSSQPNVLVGSLRKFIIPYPKDIEEQEGIVQTIESIRTRIDQETVSLQKLHSLKTGLMQDLLSGRVRVNDLKE